MHFGFGGRPAVVGNGLRPAVRLPRRILAVLLALLALQLGSLISPAYACGCGAMVPNENTSIAVDREVSAVRWDGARQDIAMRLSVRGDAREAAWIMPVPSRADVELGDRALFDELAELTAPVHKESTYFWPRAGDFPFSSEESDGAGAGAPERSAPPVGVTGRERLGPFDVARLTASDPDALAGWLKDEGFHLPARLSQALRPYVDQGWSYVAVRLAPAEGGAATLGGALDPLRISFASDRLVYPMRLSQLARQPQTLDLYVLAAHRMETRSAIGGYEPEVTYARRLGSSAGPALDSFAGGETRYLTAIKQLLPTPSDISGDHELRQSATDDPYQEIIHDEKLLRWAGIPAWIVTFGGTALLLLALIVWRALARARRPVPPPPPVWTPPPLN
ncbi:DUF2330 domain-containing protein [Streptomyces sp. TRM66268-LWL]|uniref:DUF2330 domain-containing protein n=1 Tax=Streptomyces polyasparticus TaxID=2767826 RepID=A0ABR7SAR7_9ACTN|nr:DUF2330 domain-containing protein [Streptomyces polyasparticus]MBC9712533.1 DUF2330 domain-containing protein [Streptomyces polyasparticus]